MSDKFKIGDRVKIKTVKDFNGYENYPEEYIGKKGIVTKISKLFTEYPYDVMFTDTFDNDKWTWSEENLELCKPEIIKEYYIIVNKHTNEYVQWDGQLVLDIILADLYPDEEKAKKGILELDIPDDFEIKKLTIKYDID